MLQLHFRALIISLLLLVLLGWTGDASAQKQYSFTPQGPITIESAGGAYGTARVTFTNHSDSALTLYLTFDGDTTFKSFWRPVEWPLCAGCDVDFSVTFAGIDNLRDSARMFITDGLHDPDTIQFYAQDTGVFPWVFDSVQVHAGSRFSLPDTAWVTILNQRDEPIEVFLDYMWQSIGFTALEPRIQTIPAHERARFNFKFESSTYDSAHARVQFYGEGKIGVIAIDAAGKKPVLGDTLAWSGAADFGSIKRGTSACRTYKFYNHATSSASISSITISMNSNVFELAESPDLPFALASGDSFEVSVCFNALEEEGTVTYGGLRVGYQFAGEDVKTVDLNFAAKTAQCLEAASTFIDFDSVAVGTTSTRSLVLTNYSDAAITVDSVVIHDFSPGFALGSPASFTIPASESYAVPLSFSPTDPFGDSTHYSYVGVYMHGACASIFGAISLRAVPYYGPADTDVYELFADSTQTLVFTGDSSTSEQVFRFVNDLTDSIRIESVSLRNGTHFQLGEIKPVNPEFTLAPDSTMAVTVEFIGTPGAYEDTLIIATESGFVALLYRIVSDIPGGGVGQATSSTPILRILPNPASGPVRLTIEHTKSATIEVLDMMGKTVAVVVGPTWDARTVAKGNYFVRATGVSSEGKPFVLSRRLVIR